MRRGGHCLGGQVEFELCLNGVVTGGERGEMRLHIGELAEAEETSPAALQIGLFVLLVVNTLGSGGDILAAWLVLGQVPASGRLCFRAGRAYWQPAEG
jgi:hypothetical protein